MVAVDAPPAVEPPDAVDPPVWREDPLEPVLPPPFPLVGDVLKGFLKELATPDRPFLLVESCFSPFAFCTQWTSPVCLGREKRSERVSRKSEVKLEARVDSYR